VAEFVIVVILHFGIPTTFCGVGSDHI